MDSPPRRPALLAASLAAASLASAGLAVESAVSFGQRADGLLGLALPWAGAVFYAALAAAAWARPSSSWVSQGVGFAVFAHASLTVEAFLSGRLCWPCAAVAGLALLAGAAQLRARRADGLLLALSLGLGAASGLFEPFDRVDGALTRALWPARVYSIVPGFVDRGVLAGCEHGRPVRLLIYEKDCKT